MKLVNEKRKNARTTNNTTLSITDILSPVKFQPGTTILVTHCLSQLSYQDFTITNLSEINIINKNCMLIIVYLFKFITIPEEYKTLFFMSPPLALKIPPTQKNIKATPSEHTTFRPQNTHIYIQHIGYTVYITKLYT